MRIKRQDREVILFEVAIPTLSPDLGLDNGQPEMKTIKVVQTVHRNKIFAAENYKNLDFVLFPYILI